MCVEIGEATRADNDVLICRMRRLSAPCARERITTHKGMNSTALAQQSQSLERTWQDWKGS